MRAIAWSVWIFINLVFLGMCGYFYVLCTQYWAYVERRHAMMETYTNKHAPDEQHPIRYYPESQQDPYHMSPAESHDVSNLPLQHGLQTTPNGKIATALSKASMDKKLTKIAQLAHKQKADNKLQAKISKHKNHLMIQLRRALHDESSVFKARGNGSNPYNVKYSGPRGTYDKKSPRELVCALKEKTKMSIIEEGDEPFKSLKLSAHFPETKFLGGDRKFESCAIVSSAGSLYGSELGKAIDNHDLVLRFNHAPTREYEVDVGRKTTVRVINSQIIAKPAFNFLESPMYRDIDILVWDPSKYNYTLKEWYQNPDYNLFRGFFEHRVFHPDTGLYLLNPSTLWSLWDFIQAHMPLRIRRNPPSSGFLGLALLLPHCAYVDMFEYIPSLRMTKRCHYYESAEDMSCTFGVWHPLAAEKLLTLAMNIANNTSVFSDGYVRIPGYRTTDC